MADKRKELKVFDKNVLLVTASGKKLYPRYVYSTVNKYLALVTTVDKQSTHVLHHIFLLYI